MASSDAERVMETIPYKELTDSSALARTDVFEITEGATKYVVSSAPVPVFESFGAAGWRVIGVQPVEEAYALLFRWRYTLLGALAVSIVVVLATSFLFAGNRSRNFGRIADAARSIGLGQFSVRVPVGNVREIRDLSVALNSTAERLEAAWEARWQAEIDLTAARDDLEIKVRERTADLEQEIEVRKIAEDAALSEKQNAERASKAKSDFLANMSHELRTPLNHIIGFVQLVTDPRIGSLNDLQKEYLDDALGSSKHLLSLINEVLDLSKAESGTMSIVRGPANPKTLIESCVRSSEGQAKLKKIALKTMLGDLPDLIHVDPQKFTQVLLNLVSNAVKFTDSGGTVTVSAELTPPTDSEGPRFCVSVADTGIGIREEDLQRVFRPFEQVATQQTNAVTGTGLALSQRLVELHSGTIRAESDGLGKGSVFHVCMPAAAEEE